MVGVGGTYMCGEVRDGSRDGQEGLDGHGTVGQPGRQEHENPQASEYLGSRLQDGGALLHQGHWLAAHTGGQLNPQHVLLHHTNTGQRTKVTHCSCTENCFIFYSSVKYNQLFLCALLYSGTS